MADEIWPSISSALDETVAQLDRLQSESQNRRATNRRLLENIVARLDISGGGDDPADGPAERRERPEDRRPVAPDPPFVALPTRSTHGGPWGPAMREKLTRIALEKQGW